MPPWSRQILRFVFAAMIAVFPLALLAAGTGLPPPPAGFKMGMEVELLPEKLANLTHFFDFAKLEKELASIKEGKTISAREELFLRARTNQLNLAPELHDLTKDYLRNNPSAFRSLPAPLRKQLGEGLQLQKVMLEQRAAFLGADAQPMQKKPGLILPDAPARPELMALQKPKLVLPGAQPQPQPGVMDAKLFQSGGSIQVPNTAEWDKLIARWEALPEKERNAVVKLELLPPLEKAFLFAATVGPGGENLPQMQLKSDLEETEKALWSKLSWKKDRDAIEFIHTEPVSSPQEFLSDVRAFSRRAGVEREVFDPERAEIRKLLRDSEGNIVYEDGVPVRKARQWGSFHYHYSLKDRNLRSFANNLNVNLLVRRLDRGITSDLTGNGKYTYQSVTQRGLIRILGWSDQIENRTHLDPLEEELHRQLTPLFTKSPEDAALAIKADTERRLNDEVVRKLMASDKAFLLDQFKYDYTALIRKLEAEVANSGAQAEAVRALAKLRAESPALGPHFQRVLATAKFGKEFPQEELDMLRSWLQKGGESTADVRAQIARLLRSAVPEEVGFALGLMSSTNWPPKLATAEEAEAARFLKRLQVGELDTPELDVLVMNFAEKHYLGNRGFIPVAERFLSSFRFYTLKQAAEKFLAKSFPGDRDLFRRLGPRLMEVPANAVPAQVQLAAVTRLEFRPTPEEIDVIAETLAAYGKLEHIPFNQFRAYYLPKDQPSQGEIKLAYRMGEFHSELRERALKDIHAALARADIPMLDLVAQLGLHDPETMRLVKDYGDEGLTQTAVKVRGILDAAKSAPNSCPATFAKVAKRKARS